MHRPKFCSFRLRVFANLFLGLAVTSALADEDQSANEFGETVYSQCAACHLSSGVGVPGAFPPLRGRLAAIAARDGGQDYLLSVVLNGLNGPLQVEGVAYNGFMQAYGQILDDQQISAVLNYITTVLTDQAYDNYNAITPAKVAALRKTLQPGSTTSAALRSSLGL